MHAHRLCLASAVLVACLFAPFVSAQVSNDQFQDLTKRLQVLEDKEAIRHLLEVYIDNNESRDYRAYSQMFASNGEIQLRVGSATGPDNIYKLMEENFGGPLPENSMLRNASHVLSNIIIDVDGDTATAKSRWALLTPSPDNGGPRIAQSGFYNDKLVRENGEWKFLQRLIVPGIPVP